MLKCSVVIVCPLLLGTAVAHANILVNGDFESSTINPWTWSGQDSATQIVPFDVPGPYGPSLAFRVDGGDATGLIGTLSQSVSLVAGSEYVISWEQGMQNVGGATVGDAGAIELRIDDQLVHHWSQGVLLPNDLAGMWEEKTFTPSVSGPQTLEVRFFHGSSSYGSNTVFMYVDNIDLVPEPGCAVLAAIGLCRLRPRRKLRRWASS